jgi:DNA-binding MarR family transcriptional regulator
MCNSKDFMEITNKLQKLFQERDNSYTLCVVIGDIECAFLRFLNTINKPITMKQIAERYNISNAKVTRVLDTLVRMKFVERYHNETDRRSLFAKITEEGRRMAENTKYKLNQFQQTVLDKLPTEDIEPMYKYMKSFTDAYEEAIAESEETPSLEI